MKSGAADRQDRQNGVNTRNGFPLLFLILSGSNSSAELNVSTCRPSDISAFCTFASRERDAGSYRRFQNTASAPHSRAIERSASSEGPRRRMRPNPLRRSLASSDCNDWCSHQRLAAPGGQSPSSSGAQMNTGTTRSLRAAAAASAGLSASRRSSRNHTSEVEFMSAMIARHRTGTWLYCPQTYGDSITRYRFLSLPA